MAKPITAYIGLGSNLADRQSLISQALELLAQTGGIELSQTSDLYETAPLSSCDQPSYINAAAEIKTTLTAEALLGRLGEIENSLGRVRTEKWASRTIDLDMLIFGDQLIDTDKLTVPHRQMHLRSFVLKGLCQLNPDLMHPVLKETIVELAQRLNGADFMINPDRPQLISIAGLIGAGKTTLTELLSKKLSCKTLLEPYDKNPFLSDVYAGKTELALDSQLFFLTERACQLNPEVLPAGKTVISDYLFEKELIYAKRLLDAKQLDCYQQKYRSVSPTVTKPMLVIYLTDSAQQCLERIHKRNRPYEQKIDLQFLRDLHYDYQQLFESWKKSPVIRMSMSDFDIKNSDSLDYLLSQIKSYITT